MSSSNLSILVNVKLKFKKLCTRKQFGSKYWCASWGLSSLNILRLYDLLQESGQTKNQAEGWNIRFLDEIHQPFGGELQFTGWNTLASKKFSSFIWYANSFSIESTAISLSWLFLLYEIWGCIKKRVFACWICKENGAQREDFNQKYLKFQFKTFSAKFYKLCNK